MDRDREKGRRDKGRGKGRGERQSIGLSSYKDTSFINGALSHDLI